MKSRIPLSASTVLTFALLVSVVCFASCSRGCSRSGPPQNDNSGAAPSPASPNTTTTTNGPDQPDKPQSEEDDSVEPADQTVVARVTSSVRQVLSAVFRIRGSSRPLLSNRTYPLKTGDRIKTSDSGTAQVNIANCMTIYVFASSGLTMSACPGFAKGSAVCSNSGTSLFNNRCSSRIRKVETDTAEIRLEGTYFRVAYWPEKKRTIIDVHEGPVQVRQLLDAKERKFGDPVKITEGCWCAPSDQCFVAGVPSDGPQPCTKLTPENAAYLDKTTKQTSDRVARDHTLIAPGPLLDGLTPNLRPTIGTTLPDAVDFGTVEIGSEAARSITLTNISSLPLKFNSFSLEDRIRYFQLDKNTCANNQLEMGKTCNLEVIFKPLDPGVYERFVEISDNAKGSPRKVLVRGVGEYGWAATTSFEPLSVKFDEQPVGTASSRHRVSIFKTYPIAPPVIEGPAKDDFKIVSNNCTDDKRRCEIEVEFTPTVAGYREAKIVISPSVPRPGAIQPRKEVPLLGFSTPPKTSNPSPVLTSAIKIPTSEVCFNAHKEVDPKAVEVRTTKTISVTNAGEGPLLINSITTTKDDFIVQSENCTGTKVTKECKISVGFTPTATGMRYAKLVITSNDPKEPETRVRIAGRGKSRNWFIRGLHWMFRNNQGDKCKF